MKKAKHNYRKTARYVTNGSREKKYILNGSA